MTIRPVTVILLVCCFRVVSSAGNHDQAYPPSSIHINCGSVGSSGAVNGKEWIGDKHPKLASQLQMKGRSTSSTSTKRLASGDRVIYGTARISHSPFLYSFQLNPGPKILRLHFNPTPYKGFTSFRDLFTVEAAQFTLLQNFSASLTAQALGLNKLTKEFYISTKESQFLDITFSPSAIPSQDEAYAFINGIEIIQVPEHLNYFQGQDFGGQVVGQQYVVHVDNSSALELIHRLKVKRASSSLQGDEFGMFAIWGTVTKQKTNEINNLTWKRLIDIGFGYLVRVHFSELGLNIAENGHLMFTVLINEITVDTSTTIVKKRDKNGGLHYRDYVVVMKGRKQDGQRDLSISIQSNNEFIDEHTLLKGFEILKVSNTDNNLASPNPSSPVKSSPTWTSEKFIRLLGLRDAAATVATAVIALVCIVVHYLWQISEADYKEEENKPSARADRHCRRFSLAEIETATKSFSDAFLIGKGGFGRVYKGIIDNGKQIVAIKRRSKLYSRQGSREFLTEIETLSELRHVNLVSLIGYCNEWREMIIVYEYISFGTLADHLYKLARKNDNSSSITWKQRLNICIGAGRGLEHLHTCHRIIHRDVKASNILLDENLTAKVADFGLAKPEDRSKLQSHVSTNVKGTFGYFDPHYIRTRKLTTKSDTYAFGVVLLQVLCGRPAMDENAAEDEHSLTKWARNKLDKGEVNDIVASSLIGDISPDSLKVFVEVAVSCLHDEPKKRPSMDQVVVQ